MDKNKASMEWNIPPRAKDYEEGSSYSSMPMYILDSSEEDSKFLSNWTPIVVIHNAPLWIHVE